MSSFFPKGRDLAQWLSRLPTDARDAAIEERLGLSGSPPSPAAPGDHLIGYHASGVDPILRSLHEVPVVPSDTVIDLGSGLGKVVFLAHLITGASARGIEIQGALVDRARRAAAERGIGVSFVCEDVRTARLDDGTVFYLYLPFTGPVLDDVLRRLHSIASRRPIVVCALGLELPKASWLVPRPLDAFWLTIYDSVIPGVPSRASV